MTDKPKRFQLFLHEWFDITAEAANANGTSLSSECRHRIARSFWLDALEQYIRKELLNARGDRLDTLRELLQFLDSKRKEVQNHVGIGKTSEH